MAAAVTPSGATPEHFDRSQLEFVTRGVSDAEVAAVTALLRGLLQEESDQLRRSPQRTRSAWDRGQRAIRSKVEPGAGRWRSFTG
ncbi:acyl-CoA carboxylase epsilon subunit [Glaciibacter sp. 2TAF33]|uniref:acyl-CoA carboxylase epsilon subunit n=1 Tax=Glaciibacter sp. 2TAF33 TaxID=3233015 RepID=UPI003F8E38BB